MLKKTNNRRMSLGLLLVFVLSMLLPVGTALAAGCEISFVAKTGVEAGDDPQDLGYVKITEIEECDFVQVEVSLPAGVEWDTPMSAGNVVDYIYIKDENGSTIDDGLYISADENSYTVRFDNSGMFEEDAQIRAVFNSIIVSHSAPDNIAPSITIQGVEQGLIAWTVTSSGSQTTGDRDVSITCTQPKIVQSGSQQLTGELKFSESDPATLKVGDQYILTLPQGCEWQSATIENGRYGLKAQTSISGKELKVDITAASAIIKDILTLQGTIKILPSVSTGNISADITGELANVDYDGSRLIIAKNGSAQTNISAIDSSKDTVYPASYNRAVDDIKLSSNGTFAVGSTITLTLNNGLSWYNTWTAGSTSIDGVKFIDFYNDNRSAWFEVNEAVDEIVFTNLLVAALPDAPLGEIKVSIGGDYTGSVMVGDVESAAAAVSQPLDVQAGGKNQAAGDIQIEETSINSFEPVNNRPWRLTVELPAGVTFAAIPDVEVNDQAVSTDYFAEMRGTVFTAGDSIWNIEFDPADFKVNRKDRITLSGLSYNLDGRVPAGDIKVKLGGYMLNKLYGSGNSVVKDLEKTYGDSAVLQVSNAVADRSGITATTMTLGSLEMLTGGTAFKMDVAPYIKNDRTYLPLRYVAYAIGLEDKDIQWDSITQTVTLVKGDTTVQVQIGSPYMKVNGEVLTMDTVPEIAYDRTMLPVRFVAEAFGASVSWDSITHTVSIFM